MTDTQLCEYTKTLCIVHFKRVDFIVCGYISIKNKNNLYNLYFKWTIVKGQAWSRKGKGMAQDGSASSDRTGARSSPPASTWLQAAGTALVLLTLGQPGGDRRLDCPFEGLAYPHPHLILTNSLWREARWRLIHRTHGKPEAAELSRSLKVTPGRLGRECLHFYCIMTVS